VWKEGLYRPDLDAGPYERQGYELDVLVANARAEDMALVGTSGSCPCLRCSGKPASASWVRTLVARPA
jgi:hypothetical protein